MPHQDKTNFPYTLAFKLPPDCQSLIAAFHRKLSRVCEGFAAPEIAHVSLKYLGYSGPTMTEEAVISMIPRIREIAAPFLPIRIFIRGLALFGSASEANQVVFLKVMPNEQLFALHEAITNGLGGAIDSFPHTDGQNYRPHVTLSMQIRPNLQRGLERIVNRSRQAAKRQYKLRNLVLLTPQQELPVFPEFQQYAVEK